MKKNGNKLTGVVLATAMGLGCTGYPVYAQEETEINSPTAMEDITEPEQGDNLDETETVNEITENEELSVDVNTVTAETETDNGVTAYTEKNAGSFNVTGGTSGIDWSYDESANTLTFNTSGTYSVVGNGQQTSDKIVVADNFNGTITIENINIQTGQPFYVANTANLTLMLEGTNRLQSTQDFQTALMFQGAITGHLVIDSKNNGSLEARGQNSAGIGGGYGTGSDANNITIKGGTINAYGGLDGAGIGSGYLGKASNIKITGGTVNAFGANNGGAGIGSGNGGYAENIIIEGGIVYASAPNNGAGIGSGWNGEANNIKITGGMVTAIGEDGAGIGGGRGGIANDITVTGGTVTATSYRGYGIGSGYNGSSSNITIIGGSVKASMSSKPTDGNGNIVYLTKIDELYGIDEVIVDGNQAFVRNGAHEGDDAFYLYLTGKNHTVSANGKMYQLQWNGDSGFLIKETISAPTVNISSKTISSITVRPLADTDIFGDAEYSINNNDWQSSNVFTGLAADTEYIVYARYKGNDRYTQSETGSIIVKTLKDGNALVEDSKPTNLSGVYGQKLSEIKLPDDWTWLDKDTALSVGTQSYTAQFDTTDYEKEYDFTGIEGYNAEQHYVRMNLTIDVLKADSSIEFTTSSLDKEYDGNVVNLTVKISGSKKYATFTWHQKNGDGWKKLSSAPVDVGNYKVAVSVEADDNYNGATAELEFAISQTTNTWTNDLSIEDWIYGKGPNSPTATSKYGTVTFTYSNKEDGTYTETVPTEAGTWYVKASVVGNENYTGLESIESFEIKKADSSITITTSSLDKAYDGNAVEIPEYTKSGSKGQVTIKWQKNTGTDSSPVWEDLTDAPSTAGSYQVVVELVGDDNYESASVTKTFAISKSENKWVKELSIDNWTYGDEAKNPIATSKYGAVTFTYSDTKDGAYIDAVPTNAGTYYVKATVDGNENYTGLEEIMSFEISKAVPEYSVPTDLTIVQGNPLSAVKLPKGFTWKDSTQTTDTLGTQPFKAVFTPEDTANYQTVELDITVEVVPAVSVINKAPKITAEDKTLTVGDIFDAKKDVTATDAEDGDITAQIEVIKNTVDTTQAGTYEVTYKVTDSQGASATKTINVTVNPKMETLNSIPTITAEDKTLTVGDDFDPMDGVTAIDKEDGNLTDSIQITENTVDTSKAGKYTVVYEVTDSHGTRVVRTIYVTVQQKTTDTDKEDSNKNSTKDTAQTSTQTNVMAWSVLGIASLGALLAVLFKRKH